MSREDAVLLVRDRVRDQVRARGLDPIVDADDVRTLVEQSVGEFALRDVLIAEDPSGCAQAVLDSVAGYGALQPLFDDPTVEEIWINEPGRVFVARDGRSELTAGGLEAAEVRRLVEQIGRAHV